MTESYGFNYLNKSTFTVYALAILLGVNSLPAQTDLANEPDAEVEDDILTLPLAIDETEDDADDFETFLEELSLGDPESDMGGFAPERPASETDHFQETNELDRFRTTPFGRRDEVDVSATPPVEDENSFGLDLTQRRDGDEELEEEPKRATIRALEKITARITDLDINVGNTTQFKSLVITVRTCHKRPPEEMPETTAFLEIIEQKLDGDTEPLFTGWMFASSPGLSALEHPVYDVWVIDCKTLGPVQSTGME